MNVIMYFKINVYVIINKNNGKCKYYMCVYLQEGFGGISSLYFILKLFEYFYI